MDPSRTRIMPRNCSSQIVGHGRGRADRMKAPREAHRLYRDSPDQQKKSSLDQAYKHVVQDRVWKTNVDDSMENSRRKKSDASRQNQNLIKRAKSPTSMQPNRNDEKINPGSNACSMRGERNARREWNVGAHSQQQYTADRGHLDRNPPNKRGAVPSPVQPTRTPTVFFGNDSVERYSEDDGGWNGLDSRRVNSQPCDKPSRKQKLPKYKKETNLPPMQRGEDFARFDDKYENDDELDDDSGLCSEEPNENIEQIRHLDEKMMGRRIHDDEDRSLRPQTSFGPRNGTEAGMRSREGPQSRIPTLKATTQWKVTPIDSRWSSMKDSKTTSEDFHYSYGSEQGQLSRYDDSLGFDQ